MIKENLVLIGQTLGRRKTGKEKLLFINTISEPLLKQGIRVQLHQNPNRSIRSNNLLVGDMDRCDLLIAAPYNTGRRMLVPGARYYPLDCRRNKANEQKNLLLYALLTIAAAAVIFYASPLVRMPLPWPALAAVIDVLMIAVIWYAIQAPSPSCSMNRASAACAVLYELCGTPCRKTGFVFADQAIESNLGYIQLSSWFHEEIQRKTVILLDAISDAESLAVCSRPDSALAAELAASLHCRHVILQEQQYENTPLASFPDGILITGGTMENGTPAVANSRNSNDYHINVSQVEQIAACLQKAVRAHEQDGLTEQAKSEQR